MVRVIAIGGRLLALFLVFLVIALIIFFFFWQITVAPGRGLGLMRLSFDKEGGSVALFGSIAASAASYRGFSYRIKEDTLFITVWAGMINPFYRWGDYWIEITDDRLSTVECIVIESGRERVQIYPKKAAVQR